MDYYSVHEPFHTMRFLAGLARHRYDFGIVLQYSDAPHTSIVPYRIVKFAARKICGTAHTFHKSVAYDYSITRKPGDSMAKTGLRLLDAIGMDTRIYWNQEPLLSSRLLAEKLVSIGISRDPAVKTVALILGANELSGVLDGVFMTSPCKIWPLSNWRALSDTLVDSGCRVILLGGKKEGEQLDESKIENKAVLNFVGKCGIAESIALLGVCDLAIGADTGLMHCAGALGVPSLSLFGPTSPAEYLPFGSRAQYLTSNQPCAPCFGTDAMLKCKDFACMRRITPQMAYNRAMDMLKQ